MRRLMLLIVALATLLPSLAFSYDVLVLQSRHDTGYDEVMKGFHFERKPSLRMLVLSDYAEVDVVRIVREDRPKLILAVGDAALKAARKVQQTPIISVMSLGVHTIRNAQANVTGVGMFGPPEDYIALFRSLKARRIGVVCNPAKSGWYLRLARHAAEAAGVQLVVREVSSPRETFERLTSLTGKVDAIWMLPDSTAVTRETTETYFHFGQQNAVPVVSFATNYLGLGAAAVLEIDRVAIGRQADLMSSLLLQGNSVGNVPISFPKGITLKTNPTVLRRLNLSLTD